MILLGIETSCDETSAALLKDGKILSNIVHSQQEHKYSGGVIPDLASKNHEKLIYKIVNKCIIASRIKIYDINVVCVTYGPGLVSSLLVGINFAKGLSLGLNIPIIGINHLEGHLVSNLINKSNIKYPYLCLLVSGGHTQIVLVKNNSYSIISRTVDDAAGEAFDKGAKILGLNYPGGPEIEKAAIHGNNTKYKFTIPNVKSNPNNFSFSGIKTSLLYLIKRINNNEFNQNFSDIAASYQEIIIDTLFNKLLFVLNNSNVKNVSIVGGVSANKRFRKKAQIFEKLHNIYIEFPNMKYCTDNAAMIAMAGYLKVKNNISSPNDIVPEPNLNF